MDEPKLDSDENTTSSSKFVELINNESSQSNDCNQDYSQIYSKLSDDNEPFYFENDTLALKNNPDYSCLLKTLVLLEGQRVQACKDLETLNELKEKALNDPVTFVKHLSKKSEEGPDLGKQIPPRQKVYVLPEINWNKYYECVDTKDLEAIRKTTELRTHSLRQTNRLIQQQIEQDQATTSTARSSSRIQHQPKKNPQGGEKNVRNYNKPWTVEEQRQLEELLLEFQPEDNEAARWRKIATKLGTRTPLQVQSHCQKYFIKLAKAGLPIPGRMPNLKTYVTKKGNRGNRRGGAGGGRARAASLNNPNSRRMVGRGSSLNEISSMWTSFNPPITMNDENENDFNQELDNEYENEDEEYEGDENEEEYGDGDDDDENDNQFEDDSYNNDNFNQSPTK